VLPFKLLTTGPQPGKGLVRVIGWESGKCGNQDNYSYREIHPDGEECGWRAGARQGGAAFKTLRTWGEKQVTSFSTAPKKVRKQTVNCTRWGDILPQYLVRAALKEPES